MRNRELGTAGEDAARRFLEKQGYKIIATNYRSQLGEIDIIGEDQDTLVFIEVKTRSSNKFGSPAEAVTRKKQQRLHQLAAMFLIERQLDNMPVRFDVLSLTKTGNRVQIEHIPGAF
uniref:UPF0102 protein ENX16_00740 n=1 Tax=candidate division WOR-3 bacterium TaxID=2052148 RepID=A0A7V3UZF8_UNCW3